MEDQEKKSVKEVEIDLIALAKTLWGGRRVVIRTVIIFAIFGLFVALFSSKEYTATTTMIPQINSASSKIGGLSSLASLAGFNIDMSAGGSELSPIIYPQIVSSTSFQLEILNTKFSFEELEEEVTLFDYYLDYYKPGFFEVVNKYTIGLPGLISRAIRGEREFISEPIHEESEIIWINRDQWEILKSLRENLTLAINDKDGYLTFVSRFHQASLSAQIAEKAKELLQTTITELKVEKATAQLLFIEERYKEKKAEFEKAQSNLAEFRDANKNISTAIMLTQEQRLENEYQLAFDVYSELAKQLEQSLIKVKEDTPVFSVIEEVVVPIERSKPKRVIILIVFTFMGGVFGIGLIIFGKHWSSIKKHWIEI